MSLVQLSTVRDRPIVAGDVRLSPESQVLMVRLPFAGLVWHRPTAILVEQAGRAVRRLPILDLTRAAQVGLLVGTPLITAVCLIVASPQES